jgi:hypothetical protein
VNRCGAFPLESRDRRSIGDNPVFSSQGSNKDKSSPQRQ